jgi:hypothetical protein
MNISVANEFHPLLIPKLNRALAIGAAVPNSRFIAAESALLHALSLNPAVTLGIKFLKTFCGDSVKEYGAIDLITPNTLDGSFVGTGFTQSKDGLEFPGTANNYMNLGCSPTTINDSASAYICLRTTKTSTTGVELGVNNASVDTRWLIASLGNSGNYSTNLAGCRVTVTTTPQTINPGGTAAGFHAGLKLTNTTGESYKNTTKTLNVSCAAPTLLALNFFLGGNNNNGTHNNPSNCRIAAVAGGSGTAAVLAVIYAAFENYYAACATF